MKNILTLTKPLFSVTEALLRSINKICAEQSIAYFIAGATAREILIHNVYGRSIGRRTRDVDFAVFVAGWDRFDALKHAFNDAGAQSINRNPHRMVMNGIELDIIPFGGISEGNQIAWPPDRTIIMSVDGFEEAFSESVLVELYDGELIPFCSLPGLALLKLFAWRDRGAENGKDAADLYKILNEYGLIEEDRIYELPVRGEEMEWDVIRMGAYLLGADIAAISGVESQSELQRLDKEKIIDAIVRQSNSETAENIEQIIDDFWAGAMKEKD